MRNTTLGLTCTRRAVSQAEKAEDVVTRAEEDEDEPEGGEGWESGRFIVEGSEKWRAVPGLWSL